MNLSVQWRHFAAAMISEVSAGTNLAAFDSEQSPAQYPPRLCSLMFPPRRSSPLQLCLAASARVATALVQGGFQACLANSREQQSLPEQRSAESKNAAVLLSASPWCPSPRLSCPSHGVRSPRLCCCLRALFRAVAAQALSTVASVSRSTTNLAGSSPALVQTLHHGPAHCRNLRHSHHGSEIVPFQCHQSQNMC